MDDDDLAQLYGMGSDQSVSLPAQQTAAPDPTADFSQMGVQQPQGLLTPFTPMAYQPPSLADRLNAVSRALAPNQGQQQPVNQAASAGPAMLALPTLPTLQRSQGLLGNFAPSVYGLGGFRG